ncbi:hypothetical protein D9611_010001 [Ephemerocybe angulata]|uniref:RlpA-like protein double-psi beta-barrel domain-containing protein n=1 Tax=Ephemerocybe angulata TaxID=980116 RepID=A0A8H5C6J7_9AGAR|nr:hypothetical protein D9611_010001 [Tulosesus angulatus]
MMSSCSSLRLMLLALFLSVVNVLGHTGDARKLRCMEPPDRLYRRDPNRAVRLRPQVLASPLDILYVFAPPLAQHTNNSDTDIVLSYLVDEGRSIHAVVVDSCPSCNPYNIDLSPSAFMALAPLSVGRLHNVTWNYMQSN